MTSANIGSISAWNVFRMNGSQFTTRSERYLSYSQCQKIPKTSKSCSRMSATEGKLDRRFAARYKACRGRDVLSCRSHPKPYLGAK
jgi:hypothetical protein